MIQAGNAIDCTLGVTFGLSTLSAAAVGGLVSNASGIFFGYEEFFQNFSGFSDFDSFCLSQYDYLFIHLIRFGFFTLSNSGTLASLAKRAGLPSSNLTAQQRSLSFIKRNRLFSQAVGVLLGCTLGLINLFFIDTERSSSLKLQHMTEENEFAFEVECHNDNPNATTLIVSGPDNDGLLAGLTAALALYGCSILDVSAQKLPDGRIEDKFSVVNQTTRRRLDDDDLLNVSKLLLDASKEGPLMLKAQVSELEDQNEELQERIKHLEDVLLKRRMTIRRSQ